MLECDVVCTEDILCWTQVARSVFGKCAFVTWVLNRCFWTRIYCHDRAIKEEYSRIICNAWVIYHACGKPLILEIPCYTWVVITVRSVLEQSYQRVWELSGMTQAPMYFSDESECASKNVHASFSTSTRRAWVRRRFWRRWWRRWDEKHDEEGNIEAGQMFEDIWCAAYARDKLCVAWSLVKQVFEREGLWAARRFNRDVSIFASAAPGSPTGLHEATPSCV